MPTNNAPCSLYVTHLVFRGVSKLPKILFYYETRFFDAQLYFEADKLTSDFVTQDSHRNALQEELAALRAEEKLLDEWERQRKDDEDALQGKKRRL